MIEISYPPQVRYIVIMITMITTRRLLICNYDE